MKEKSWWRNPRNWGFLSPISSSPKVLVKTFLQATRQNGRLLYNADVRSSPAQMHLIIGFHLGLCLISASFQEQLCVVVIFSSISVFKYILDKRSRYTPR